MSQACVSKGYIREAQKRAMQAIVSRKITAALGSPGVEHKKAVCGDSPTQGAFVTMTHVVAEEVAQPAQYVLYNPGDLGL